MLKHESGSYSAPTTVAGEKNDCGVRALMIAACIDYATAHEHCRKAGRVNGRGMWHRNMQQALLNAGFSCQRIDITPRSTKHMTCRIGRDVYPKPQMVYRYQYPTLNQFAQQHSRGHYIVRVDRHYVALCDGVLHDWTWRVVKLRADGTVMLTSRNRSKRGVRNFWKLI